MITLLDPTNCHLTHFQTESYAGLVPNDEPWKSTIAEDLDKMTMEQLVESYAWTTGINRQKTVYSLCILFSRMHNRGILDAFHSCNGLLKNRVGWS